MQRVHRASFVVAQNPYRLQKRFRHEEDFHIEPPKWYKFIYSQEDGLILGHTPMRWCTILLFYICFYAGLIILWTICWFGFKPTVSSFVPSELQEQPGMSVHPLLDRSFEIKYHEHKDVEIKLLKERIDELLEKYGPREVQFSGCEDDDVYGYESSEPCFFIKVNRMIGFKVKPYEKEKDLPGNAPKELKELIKQEEAKNRVYVTCKCTNGKAPKFTFSPEHQSVPIKLIEVKDTELNKKSAFYHPDDYQRIIAVKVTNLKLHERITVHCYLWAKNIEQDEDGNMGRGMVRFYMEILENPFTKKKKKQE